MKQTNIQIINIQIFKLKTNALVLNKKIGLDYKTQALKFKIFHS